MVRYSRFAFDDPRGPDALPLVRPLEDFDDPVCDGADAAVLDPQDSETDDESDESSWSCSNREPQTPEPPQGTSAA